MFPDLSKTYAAPVVTDALGMNEPIETLLFDFGGTLDANGVAWKERFYGFYRAEGLDMAPEAFEPGFFAANSSLIGNLPPATDLSGTVHALVANLEVELSRRSRADKPHSANGRANGYRGARVASRFLSEASAAFARNRPVLEVLKQRYRLGVVSNFYGNLEAVCQGAGLASLFAVLVERSLRCREKPDPAIFRWPSISCAHSLRQRCLSAIHCAETARGRAAWGCASSG